MLLNVQIHIVLVRFGENILTNKQKKKNIQDTFETQTSIHVLSALVKRVPSSASTTSTEKQPGRWQQWEKCRNNSIVNLSNLYLWAGAPVIDSHCAWQYTTNHLRRVRGGWMKRNGWVWLKKKTHTQKDNMSRREALLYVVHGVYDIRGNFPHILGSVLVLSVSTNIVLIAPMLLGISDRQIFSHHFECDTTSVGHSKLTLIAEHLPGNFTVNLTPSKTVVIWG